MLYLCLALSIPSHPMLMQHIYQPITNIWSTSYHHVTILVHRSWPHLLFTVASVHRCQVLFKLHRHTRSLTSKPPTCPSHLQPVHRVKPHLDLLHFGHMTPYHVSYTMSSSIITWITFGLISCVSYISTISPPKLSLNYQNQTRIFQRWGLINFYYYY